MEITKDMTHCKGYRLQVRQLHTIQQKLTSTNNNKTDYGNKNKTL